MADIVRIEPGLGRSILIVVAHADDPALFLGGTIAQWSRTGWRVVVMRVTDDRWDSLGLDEATTIARNKQEFDAAVQALGIAELIELGWATDVLGDRSEVELRERVIWAVRRHRPYALVTFDPYSMYGEDNQDHVLVAKATDEAFWTAQFEKHHPEHLAGGLQPHGVAERWYFGRRVMDVTDVVDISTTLDTKIAAALCHRAMLTNMANQLRLQAETAGLRVPLAERALAGDLEPLFRDLIGRSARACGARHGLAAAEEFRVVRLGGLSDWLRSNSEPL